MGMGDWFPQLMRDYSKAYSESWGDYTTEDGTSPATLSEFLDVAEAVLSVLGLP